jgi:hypothetical protein
MGPSILFVLRHLESVVVIEGEGQSINNVFVCDSPDDGLTESRNM